MAKISLTTNISLRDYRNRLKRIVERIHPEGIEIIGLPEDYPNKIILEKNNSDYRILNSKLAEDIGKSLKEYEIKKIQYHYPWQMGILDMNHNHLIAAINFCDILLNESQAEQLTINYHNSIKYPTDSMIRQMTGKQREKSHNTLEQQAISASQIKKYLKSDCLLLLESNSPFSKDYDERIGAYISDTLDIVAEDYIHRKGVDGVTLDIPHIWQTVEGFKLEKPPANLQWCKKQYGGIPESAQSLENYIRIVAEKINWIHLADEKNPYKHEGLHIGDGKINFEEVFGLLKKYLKNDVVATIEVKDGHNNGFERILKEDYPRLMKFIKKAGLY